MSEVVCKNCGKPISYHEGSRGWFHLPFMNYYCKIQPRPLSSDPHELDHAEPKE